MVRAEDWGRNKGCTMFVFDNTANGLPRSDVLDPVRTGETSIVIRFGQNPGVNLTVLIYGEFEKNYWRLIAARRSFTTCTDSKDAASSLEQFPVGSLSFPRS